MTNVARSNAYAPPTPAAEIYCAVASTRCLAAEIGSFKATGSLGTARYGQSATRLPDGTPYSVTILRQPVFAECEVRHGSGTIRDRDVDDVEVRCDR